MGGKYDIKPVGTVSLEAQDSANLPDVTSGTAQLSYDGSALVVRTTSGQTTETTALSKVEYVEYVSGIDDFDGVFTAAWEADVSGGNLIIGTGLLVAEIHSFGNPPLRAAASRVNTKFYPSQYPEVEYRFTHSASAELDWRIGLENGGFESGLALQSEAGVVTLILKSGGGTIDTDTVVLPTLGDEVAYRLVLNLTPSSAQLWMCADRGTLTLVGEVSGVLPANTALTPYMEAYSADSITGSVSIVADYVRWRARRIVPTPVL